MKGVIQGFLALPQRWKDLEKKMFTPWPSLGYTKHLLRNSGLKAKALVNFFYE